MANFICNVCRHALTDNIYSAPANRSLTSLCASLNEPTDVYFCHHCGHVQTIEYENKFEYYDASYNILINSEEEDQVYLVIEGQPVYRTDHQISTLIAKVELIEGLQVLDFGCAKSATMAKLLKRAQAIEVFLYDVSSNYIPFWEKFTTPNHWSTHEIPASWLHKFDLVTSFFSLEHISNLTGVIQDVKSVLKKNGLFYLIVPNVFTNSADMIVADHPNHFTDVSISYLLSQNGFQIVEIDPTSHRGAMIVIAKQTEEDAKSAPAPAISHYQAAMEIARFWSNSWEKISVFEKQNQALPAAIYGAGFYGAFIANALNQFGSVHCFIDQNPFLQGHSFFGRTIIAPASLPENIAVIYVGLNPAYGRNIIENIAYFAGKKLTFIYL